jgi:hypothetical protein
VIARAGPEGVSTFVIALKIARTDGVEIRGNGFIVCTDWIDSSEVESQLATTVAPVVGCSGMGGDTQHSLDASDKSTAYVSDVPARLAKFAGVR